MLAWEWFGNVVIFVFVGQKFDYFVGYFYVKFEQAFKEEYKIWQVFEVGQQVFVVWKVDEKVVKKVEKMLDEKVCKVMVKVEWEGKGFELVEYMLEKYFFGMIYKNIYFNEYSEFGQVVKVMLLKWEVGDEEVIVFWKQMNGWVYEGFDEIYEWFGVEFDKLYYEFDIYLFGKDMIKMGFQKGIFYEKEDGLVWIDLMDVKFDYKLVLWSDGIFVYIIQDIGIVQEWYKDFGVDKMVYVVVDEQDYYFKVLFEILKWLGEFYVEGFYYFSYGMVDLFFGKMKSWEGIVVDVDDLMVEVIVEAW